MAKSSKPDDLNNEIDNDDNPFEGFLDYLKSTQGNEIAKLAAGHIEKYKSARFEGEKEIALKTTAMRSVNYKWTLVVHALLLFFAIASASVLTYFKLFDSTIGVFFGTLLGYVFGKQPSGK